MTETELYRGGIWIRRVKWSALLLLIGLILLVFLLNLGSLNGDDLRRFAARVSFGLHGQALIEDGRISYLDDESRQAALFKDGLAIVANDKLKIYDSTGLEFFSTSAVMLNPVLQTTPKQVLVFDRGDGSLQVYNSFDQVFALELEEPIINASLNDSGALIVAHKAEGYKSQLTLYDTGFNERYKWYWMWTCTATANSSPRRVLPWASRRCSAKFFCLMRMIPRHINGFLLTRRSFMI